MLILHLKIYVENVPKGAIRRFSRNTKENKMFNINYYTQYMGKSKNVDLKKIVLFSKIEITK